VPAAFFHTALLAAASAAAGIAAGLLAARVMAAVTRHARQARIDAFVHRSDGSAPRKEKRDRHADSRRKAIDTKIKSLQEGKRHGKSRIGAVRVYAVRAGLNMTIVQFWGFCGLSGLGAAGACYALAGMGWSVPAAFGLGAAAVPMTLGAMAGRRQKKFTVYFPPAIDIIVRGLKSGLPLQECFRIIGREIPDPCGSEFRSVMDEVNAGLTLEEALERAYQRMPTQELRFFSTVFAIQSQTGGNLTEILGNLSVIMRGRLAMREKIKALSSEAKMTSAIVGAMPFLIGGILAFANYGYISMLWTDPTGQYCLAGACGLMGSGVLVMARMSRFEM
jgi:tight adherence protein B